MPGGASPAPGSSSSPRWGPGGGGTARTQALGGQAAVLRAWGLHQRRACACWCQEGRTQACSRPPTRTAHPWAANRPARPRACLGLPRAHVLGWTRVLAPHAHTGRRHRHAHCTLRLSPNQRLSPRLPQNRSPSLQTGPTGYDTGSQTSLRGEGEGTGAGPGPGPARPTPGCPSPGAGPPRAPGPCPLRAGEGLRAGAVGGPLPRRHSQAWAGVRQGCPAVARAPRGSRSSSSQPWTGLV